MTDRDEALRCYGAALEEPSPERLEALGGVLASDVVVVGPVGAGRGLEAVRAALANPRSPGMLTGATWGKPQLDGECATVEVGLRPGLPLAGLILHVRFDAGGRIDRIEQQLLPAPRPDPSELLLTEAMKEAVAGAFANGTPIVLAYVDESNAPHLSYRGTTQPFGDTELALWVRDPAGGLLQAIARNPDVALLYRDPATRTSYQFAGRARVVEDPVVRDAVYAASPELERNTDARRLGAAVVVDLDRVEGSTPAGRIRMERSAGRKDGAA